MLNNNRLSWNATCGQMVLVIEINIRDFEGAKEYH
jgi:hypothetical protein